MSMLKKSLVLFVSLMTFWSVCTTCRAEVIPAQGPGQIGLTSVVLCESLNVHKEPGTDAEVAQTLKFGDRVMVMEQKDGWAHIAVSDDVDAVPPGWVKSDYLAIDPAWYKTEDSTPVYAWNDTKANKVADLDKDTTLPILKDDGEWVVVSLRGASGWIHKTDAELAKTEGQSKKDSEQSKKESEQSKKTSDQDNSFTVYAKDGSTAVIHLAEGAMYQDAKGRTYSNTHGDMYYCIETDTTYAADPNVWVNGEPTPDDDDDDVDVVDDDDDNDDVIYDEDELTGYDYGENDDQEWTGEDFGENQDYDGDDYDEDSN